MAVYSYNMMHSLFVEYLLSSPTKHLQRAKKKKKKKEHDVHSYTKAYRLDKITEKISFFIFNKKENSRWSFWIIYCFTSAYNYSHHYFSFSTYF